jgi:hypothetical protein
MSRKIIITACPYSATKYTAELLNSIGLEVGHEVIKKDGTVSWGHIHLRREDFGPEVVMLHQVRHPLMVITQLRSLRGASKYHRGPFLWEMFMARTNAMDVPWKLPVLHEGENYGLKDYMSLWYWWNKFGTLTADGTYTIESLPDRWEWFLGMIGHEYVDMPVESKTTNRHSTPKILSWDDLHEADPELTSRILELATHFGYDQIPYQYLDDPYYQFPEKIESVTCGWAVDIFRYAERQQNDSTL